MNIIEFAELVNIEGLEYAIRHKMNINQLSDPKLVKLCHKFNRLAAKIEEYLDEGEET